MFGARYVSTMMRHTMSAASTTCGDDVRRIRLSVHKYRSSRLYRLVYFAEHRNTILPPRPETCQTTRLGPPSRQQAVGPGLAPVALSMRLQTKSGRRWRFRPALPRPICMPPPSGSLGTGGCADCMTSLLAPRTRIPRILSSCESTIAHSAAWATTNRVSCAWQTPGHKTSLAG
jgi:hypothetical protein